MDSFLLHLLQAVKYPKPKPSQKSAKIEDILEKKVKYLQLKFIFFYYVIIALSFLSSLTITITMRKAKQLLPVKKYHPSQHLLKMVAKILKINLI